jgi:membrane protein YdbS with pleckstrin-like domain
MFILVAKAKKLRMSDFSNNTIDIDSLPKFEDLRLKPLSTKYWKVVLINIFIFLLFMAAGIFALLYVKEELRQYLYLVASAYSAFALLLILLYNIGVKRRGFAVREKDIIYASGVLALSTTIVPFNRIQHIALHEGMISRFFELAELQIFTAGGSSGSLHIRGIEIAEAKNIRALLMQQINETDSEDAIPVKEDHDES